MNQAGIDLLKRFEGCRLKAYPDRPGDNPVWTIGYGHTKGVKQGDVMTQEKAESTLLDDIAIFEFGVTSLSQIPLNQNQLAALTSFAFNEGITRFANSTLLKKLNKFDFNGVADEFLKWKFMDGHPIPGLLARRDAERALFLTPEFPSAA